MSFFNRHKNFKIYLTQGRYLGVQTWHYVKIDRMKLPIFQNALKCGMLDVAQYGEVVFSGWGFNPPDEIRKKVDALYS